MSDCCLIKKVATVEVYENKNEVRAYGFMAGDKNTPMMEVKFKHLWGEENLSKCKLRWIIVDDLGSLLVGEVPIEQDNTASIQLPNELFTGDRRMKVQLTVASCDGSRILNLQQFTDLKVINNLASNEVVEPVYQMLINQVYDDTKKYLAELETSYKAKYGSLESVYAKSKASLEQYLINAENGGNAEFLQGYNPKNFNRVENTINELVNSASSKYKVGDVVEVLGYYTAGDGAHHKRIAKSADDGSGELGVDGLIWCIVHDGEVNVSWFGAKGDGITDDSDSIQKALNIKAITKFNKGVFIVTETLMVYSSMLGVKSRGSNTPLTVIKLNSSEMNKVLLSVEDGHIKFSGLKFDGIDINNGLSSIGVKINFKMSCLFEQCFFENWSKAGLLLIDQWHTTVSNCYFIKNGVENQDGSAIIGTGGIVFEEGGVEAGWSSSGNTIENCYFANGSFGVYAKSAWQLTLDNCVFEWINTPYYKSQNGLGFIENNCWYEQIKNTQINERGGFIVPGHDRVKSEVTASAKALTNVEVGDSGFRVYRRPTDKHSFVDIDGEYGFKYLHSKNNHKLEIGGLLWTSSLPDQVSSFLNTNLSAWGSYYDFEHHEDPYSDKYKVANIGLGAVRNNSGLGRADGCIEFQVGRYEHTTSASTIRTVWEIKADGSLYPKGDIIYNIGSQTNKIKTVYCENIVQTSIARFDTPYYTRKMEEEGIYVDYVAYRDELHEYEKAQSQVDETMLLPVLQEPVIPDSIKQFAEKYKLI